MAVRIPWVFYDPLTDEEYSWPINPNDATYTQRNKNIQYTATAAPNGQTIAFEGREQPQTFSFSGTILHQDQFDKFNEWFEKRHQIRLTDDLGRSFWAYITRFEPKRRRSITYPWRHDYTMEMIFLDWA